MNTKFIKILFSCLIFVVALNGCASNKWKAKPFKHNTPLIKEDIRTKGKAEIEKIVKWDQDLFLEIQFF